jgi:DNA-binding LytR/AlgR family response regulator
MLHAFLVDDERLAIERLSRLLDATGPHRGDRHRSKLDARRFVRISRAAIVNVAFVQELQPSVDGGLLVRLEHERQTELALARDRVGDLKSRLGI